MVPTILPFVFFLILLQVIYHHSNITPFCRMMSMGNFILIPLMRLILTWMPQLIVLSILISLLSPITILLPLWTKRKQKLRTAFLRKHYYISCLSIREVFFGEHYYASQHQYKNYHAHNKWPFYDKINDDDMYIFIIIGKDYHDYCPPFSVLDDINGIHFNETIYCLIDT